MICVWALAATAERVAAGDVSSAMASAAERFVTSSLPVFEEGGGGVLAILQLFTIISSSSNNLFLGAPREAVSYS